jgi:hypothetical protein
MQVNRHLKDKDMDRIDHALGRPVDPTQDTYRNHFAVSSEKDKAAFRGSAFWIEGVSQGRMTWFHVSGPGRVALEAHLKQIGDPHRLYDVTYRIGRDTHSELVAAKSGGAAKYDKWRSVSDVLPDLTFIDFCRGASVRLADRGVAYG